MTTFLITGASCHTTFNCMKSDIQTQSNKNISLLSAMQCKKVQSSIEKFHWSKKLRKTENFSFNLNIRVPLESVNLFLHVFLCLKVILTIEHYIKLLTIFIWKFAIFWSWQLALCRTTCPSVIFLLATGSRSPCLKYFFCWLAHVFGKRTPFKII